MVDMEKIVEFLWDVEGKRKLVGYVPCYEGNYNGSRKPDGFTAMGASGVTIGTGVDLGQTSVAELRGYGLGARAVGIYEPYIGKKRVAALDALYRKPLQVSESVAIETDDAVHGGYLRTYVIPAYNKASSVPYDKLPWQAQAVIMSLCYQKGCGGVRRDWPRTWGYLVAQDWCSASNELKNGFVQYAGRRRKEGKLLEALCVG